MGLRKKKSLVDQALDQASDYVDALRPHVETAYGQAKDFVQDTAIPALSDAYDKAAPAIVDAYDKASDKAAPVIADARAKAAPVIASGAALAAEKAAEARSIAAEKAVDARSLAETKIAEVKGEQPKKRSKLTTLAVLAAAAAGAAFVAKKLQGGKNDNWQSSYTPKPAPAAKPAAPVEDAGGAGPDEAISDAVEAPHPVTTPDEPAEVVDVEPETKK